MIFDDEVLCVGDVSLFKDAVLVLAHEERRDVLLKGQFWRSFEGHERWVTPGLVEAIALQRLGVRYGAQVMFERFAEVGRVVAIHPAFLDLTVNTEHEWRSCTGRNLARAMGGAM